MQPIIQENLLAIRDILHAHRVREAYLFGSAATPDRFTPESDVDILVSFKRISHNDYAENFWSLEDALRGLLRRNIDIVVAKSLRNPYLIRRIEDTKKAIL